MRILFPLIVGALLFTATSESADSRKPSFKFGKVIRGQNGKVTTFKFYFVARDNVEVSNIEYRAAVDGKVGRWTKVRYYQGWTEYLQFGVDCNQFRLEARSVDSSRNKSRISVKSYTNL